MIGEGSDAPALDPMDETDDVQDTYKINEEDNDATGRVECEGPDLHDPDERLIMSSMMDVFQK